MSKFRCPCGEQLTSSGPIPNSDEWHLLSSTDVVGFADPAPLDAVFDATTFAYLCPRSGHLLVFWDDSDRPTIYAPMSRDEGQE